MSSQEEICLSSLPSDVVRSIIRVGLESFESCRLISHRWNALALDHLSDRTHLPIIPYIGVEEGDDDCAHWTVRLRILEKFRNFYGVQKWNARNVESTGEQLIEVYHDFQIREAHMNLGDDLRKLFGKCSRIGTLDLKVFGVCTGSLMLDDVEEALEGINLQLDAVSFMPSDPKEPINYDRYYGDRLLRFVREHPVTSLTLYFSDYEIPVWIAHFAVEALQLVPQVVFEAKRDPAHDYDFVREYDDESFGYEKEIWAYMTRKLNGMMVTASFDYEPVEVEKEEEDDEDYIMDVEKEEEEEKEVEKEREKKGNEDEEEKEDDADYEDDNDDNEEEEEEEKDGSFESEDLDEYVEMIWYRYRITATRKEAKSE